MYNIIWLLNLIFKLLLFVEHNLSLHPINDGLRHRPRAEWSIMYMTSQLDKTDIWLKSALQEDINDIREVLS